MIQLGFTPVYFLRSLMSFWQDHEKLFSPSEIAQHISRLEHITLEAAWRVVNTLYQMKVIELANGVVDVCALSAVGKRSIAKLEESGFVL